MQYIAHIQSSSVKRQPDALHGGAAAAGFDRCLRKPPIREESRPFTGVSGNGHSRRTSDRKCHARGGRTVNIAARIADYARPGEVLVSQEVVDASQRGSATFTEIGPAELTGVPRTLRLQVAGRDA